MKVAIYDVSGKLMLTTTHVPEINEHEILVKQQAAGISTSDSQAYKQDYTKKLAHKNTGVITKIGSKVQNFTIGDSIYYNTFINCGRCHPCKAGYNNLCQNRSQVLPDETAYAEYVKLPHDLIITGGVYRSEGISYPDMTHIGPLSTCIHSLEKMRITPHDNVVIMGAGYMGLLHLNLLKSHDVDKITVTEVNEYRRNLAKDLGADRVVNPITDDVKQVSDEYGGADLVIVCTSSRQAMKESTEYARHRARINFYGGIALTGHSPYVELNTSHIHYKELEVMGSFRSISPGHYVEAIKLISSGTVSVSGLNTHLVNLRDINDIFEIGEDCSALRVVISD